MSIFCDSFFFTDRNHPRFLCSFHFLAILFVDICPSFPNIPSLKLRKYKNLPIFLTIIHCENSILLILQKKFEKMQFLD